MQGNPKVNWPAVWNRFNKELDEKFCKTCGKSTSRFMPWEDQQALIERFVELNLQRRLKKVAK